MVSALLLHAVVLSAQDIRRNLPPVLPRSSKANVDSIKPALIPLPQKYSSVADTGRKGIDTGGVAHADSTVRDSVRIRFLPGMGQMTDEIDTTSVMHQKQFLWSDAKCVGDLLWKLPGFFYRDLGEAGKWGQLNAFGTDGRGMGILLDGRPMNDPVTGTYNLSDIPLEFIDHAEVLSGTASYGDGTLMNFVTRSYNSYRALTKLRFVQDPKGTLLTDGLFAQNVARGINLMVGFTRQASDGYYPQKPNSYTTSPSLDAWSIRARLRYNFSDRFNVTLTDFYTKAGNGLTGGVDRANSVNIFDIASAKVLNNVQHDNRSRSDVTLSAIARLFSDSSSTTQTSFYYSTLEREYWNSLNSNIDDSTKASFWGIRIQQHLAFSPVRLTVGGNWERRQSDSTRTLPSHIESENSLFAHAEVRLLDMFIPSISLRSTSFEGQRSFNSSLAVKSVLTDWLTLFVDASRFDRYPTILERYWSDTIVVRTGEIAKEQHTFIEGGFTVQAGSNLQLNLTGFRRTVKNAIMFQPAATRYGSSALNISNISEVRSSGLYGRIIFSWQHFELFGVMTLTRTVQFDTAKTFIPDVILSGEVSYRNTFFKEKLDAKFGLRSRFLNRQQGMQFDPQTLSYSQYYTDVIGRSTTFDLFTVLKIGDAHISLSWNNILNAEYMLAPLYPLPGRNIRVGVNWVFTD